MRSCGARVGAKTPGSACPIDEAVIDGAGEVDAGAASGPRATVM